MRRANDIPWRLIAARERREEFLNVRHDRSIRRVEQHHELSHVRRGEANEVQTLRVTLPTPNGVVAGDTKIAEGDRQPHDVARHAVVGGKDVANLEVVRPEPLVARHGALAKGNLTRRIDAIVGRGLRGLTGGPTRVSGQDRGEPWGSTVPGVVVARGRTRLAARSPARF